MSAGEGWSEVVFGVVLGLAVAVAVEELGGGLVVFGAVGVWVVGCEGFVVPVLGFVAVHGLSAPPAWCAVFVVVEEAFALFLVSPSVAAGCGGGFCFDFAVG